MEKIVWRFTNKRELTKKEFLNYLERKVYRTIRKYGMLPAGGVVKVERGKSLNCVVLREILSKKFQLKFSSKPDFSCDNLSAIAERVLENVLKGEIVVPQPFEDGVGFPLYFVSDKEIEVYARLKGLKGAERKKNKKVRALIDKFIGKNPDVELNIVKAIKFS